MELESALRIAVNDRGITLFKNESLLNAIMSDLAPRSETERKKLRIALSAGAGSRFYSIWSRNGSCFGQEEVSEFQRVLVDAGLTSDFAIDILNLFLYSVSLPKVRSESTEEKENVVSYFGMEDVVVFAISAISDFIASFSRLFYGEKGEKMIFEFIKSDGAYFLLDEQAFLGLSEKDRYMVLNEKDDLSKWKELVPEYKYKRKTSRDSLYDPRIYIRKSNYDLWKKYVGSDPKSDQHEKWIDKLVEIFGKDELVHASDFLKLCIPWEKDHMVFRQDVIERRGYTSVVRCETKGKGYYLYSKDGTYSYMDSDKLVMMGLAERRG